MFTRFLASVGLQVMGSTTDMWLLEREDLMAQPSRGSELFRAMPTVVLTSRSLPVPEGADIVFRRAPAPLLPRRLLAACRQLTSPAQVGPFVHLSYAVARGLRG